MKSRRPARRSWTGISDSHPKSFPAFTLSEVLIAILIITILFAVVINSYITAAHRVEWSSFSFAAQTLILSRSEQVRAAKWDPYADPSVDQLVSTNFPEEISALNVPSVMGRSIVVTNRIFIDLVSTNPPLKRIQAEAVWKSPRGKYFTNSITTFRAPD